MDYAIKAEWITAYWQAEKLTDTRAIEQYILCKRDVVRHVANVREQQRLRREQVVEADASTVQSRLRLAKKPRVFVPRVEREFLDQFKDSSLARRKFLVLEGPSCVGKTEYARGLVQDSAHVYELNCANQREHVDLRGLVPGQHRMILFDEADPELILCKKKGCPRTGLYDPTWRFGHGEVQLQCLPVGDHDGCVQQHVEYAAPTTTWRGQQLDQSQQYSHCSERASVGDWCIAAAGCGSELEAG